MVQQARTPRRRVSARRQAAFWLVFVALIGAPNTRRVVAVGPASPRPCCTRSPWSSLPARTLSAGHPDRDHGGNGLGAKRGVLFKNATALETSARIDTVVMDKTGTLTKGEPEVTDVVVQGLGEDDMLALAAAVERESEHPLAAAVVRYAEDRQVPKLVASGFRNVPGHGAGATVSDRRVLVGNRKLMVDEGVDAGALLARRDELAATGRTAVMVAVDGAAAGVIALADAARESAAPAVAAAAAGIRGDAHRRQRAPRGGSPASSVSTR